MRRHFSQVAVLSVLAVLGLSTQAWAANGTNTTTLAQTAVWTALAWTGGTPGGIGDNAHFSFGGDQNITLNRNVTLGRLSEVGSGQFNVLRSGINAITFDNTVAGTVASVLMTRNGADATGRRIDANLVLNSDLVVTWGRVQGGTTRTHGIRGQISGVGRLSLNYAIAPTEGPDTGTTINLNGTATNSFHAISLGTAGDSESTYEGGTDLRSGNSAFGTVRFRTEKTNALGSSTTAGRLYMDGAALDLGNLSQTVGGLSGGANGSKISSTSSTYGSTVLTIKFDSDKGPFSFSGVIMDGSSIGLSFAAATRPIDLVKSGSGVQTLTGVNTYGGTTTIDGGRLIFNANKTGSGLIDVNDQGTLAVGSGATVAGNTTVKSGGTLAGTGTLSGNVAIAGIHNPGTSPGIQTFSGGLSYDSGATLKWELVGNTLGTRGTDFDGVDVTGGNMIIDTGAQLNLVFNAAGSTVNWTDTFWNEGRTWLMIDYTGTGTSSGNFGTVNVSLDSAGQSLAGIRSGASFTSTREGDNIYVSYIIPEPATAGMLLLGMVGMALRRRQKIQQA